MQENAMNFLYKVLLEELWDGDIWEITEELLAGFEASSRLGRAPGDIWLFPGNFMVGIWIVTH